MRVRSENDGEESENIDVRIEDILKRIKEMFNWKAPNPYRVQGYWFKASDCLHKLIVNILQSCNEERNVPEWLATSRTLFIQIHTAKVIEASKYTSIVHLSFIREFISGTFADGV